MNKSTKNAARLTVGTMLAASAFTIASLPAQAAITTDTPTAANSIAAPSEVNVLNDFLAGGILNGGLINGPLVNGPLLDGDVLGPLQIGQFQ
ncbi:hypothetical protein [Arthrobacter sp. EpRS71]|uniref:hypothetical protein n=1 Tax=Arthrobacter sp. EpRS71 TaxID=1743141 RepID=UPI00074622D0|nr:hypothetical protein [Arthrobacter sp. EpRS71]KUM42118.1 hypothetical protein AR689_00670 [Arthrobacter sp. EpRS71]